MTAAVHDPPVPETADLLLVAVVIKTMSTLINDKASELLKMTGQEFSRAWYAGQFIGSTDPDVVALDALMRTGTWSAPIEDEVGAS